MASNYWIKLYHEALDDPKMGRLTDSQFRLTINLFLLAGDYEMDGLLPSKDDVQWRLRNPNNFDEDIQALLDCGILIKDEQNNLIVSKFSERQAPMTAEERSRRRRERERKLEYYRTNTARKTHESCEDKEEDKDKEIDIDKDVEEEKEKISSSSQPNFIGEFVNAVRVQFTGPNQSEIIKDLVDDYGENDVLEAATWYGQNNPRNMGHALKSIDTVLRRGWNKSKKDDVFSHNAKLKERVLNGKPRNDF